MVYYFNNNEYLKRLIIIMLYNNNLILVYYVQWIYVYCTHNISFHLYPTHLWLQSGEISKGNTRKPILNKCLIKWTITIHYTIMNDHSCTINLTINKMIHKASSQIFFFLFNNTSIQILIFRILMYYILIFQLFTFLYNILKIFLWL